MKFLIIASFADSLTGFRLPLIKSLLASGLEVHVAAPALMSNKTVMGELKKLNVTSHEIPMRRTGVNPLEDLRTLFFLWLLMIKIKPSYTFCYTIKPVIYGTLAAWAGKIPKRFSLITGLGFAFIERDAKRRSGVRVLVESLYRMALARSSLVFFQNPDDELLFRERRLLPLNTSSKVVNGSGIPIEHFVVAPLPNGKVNFLLIARLLGDKGIREYCVAAKRIKERYPSAVFQLVGWIDENPDSISQQELDAWVSSGVIEYLGKMDDVRPAIENCSVYVLPSYREGTPRTVLEAMAMGRPIITTDAPGCRETVSDGENGFLVPVKSIDALVAAMERFILDPSLINNMGQRSRAMAVEKYDVHKVNAVMLKAMGIQ